MSYLAEKSEEGCVSYSVICRAISAISVLRGAAERRCEGRRVVSQNCSFQSFARMGPIILVWGVGREGWEGVVRRKM